MDDYSLYMNSNSTALPEAYSGFFAAFFAMYLIIFAVSMLLWVIIMWRIFVKAGRPGWVSLVPIYNAFVLLQVVKRPGWWLLLFFVPIVNILISFVVLFDLAKAFGKSVLFTILGLIVFQPIGFIIIAFDKSKYAYAKSAITPQGPPPSPTTPPSQSVS